MVSDQPIPSRTRKGNGDDPDPQVLGSTGVEAVGLKALLDAFEEESDDERKHSRVDKP